MTGSHQASYLYMNLQIRALWCGRSAGICSMLSRMASFLESEMSAVILGLEHCEQVSKVAHAGL